MKHGKKSEQKSAKTRGAKAGKASGSREQKTVKPSASAKSAKSSSASSEKSVSKASSKTAAPERQAGRGKDSAPGGFSNPAIASAFHRAIAKYVTAFKRLTD
jgi:hypothetical protein